MPRGGRRQGAPGKAYPQRTDLGINRHNVVPMMAAKGQAYGARKDQMDAQRALPMGPPPPPATAGPAVASTSAPTRPMPPVEITPLHAPSRRPNEPVTAGVPVGAGPGAEVLGLPDENGVADLALWLPMLEFAASQPNATTQTRNFVRRLRGAAPVS